MKYTYILSLLSIVGLGIVTSPAVADSFTQQAEQLALLRAEVSDLAKTLRNENSFFQNRLRSLESQRSDLELQLRREHTQADTLQEQIVEMEQALVPSQQNDLLKTQVLTAAEKLRDSIIQSIPYRKTERLSAIDEILSLMEQQKLSAQQAATRLWAVSEDERRLNQENNLDKQNIEVDGQSLLVEVARLGMVAMYYQSPNGAVGYIQPNDSSWSWVEITIPEHKKQVQELFLNLKKGIRTGHYTLPYAVVSK